MADVFLSYAREDAVIAGKLATLLEANGLSVWWDRRLAAGDEINDVIEHALDAAKVAIVLWSPNSVGSRWVRGEADTAAEANKLIPVRIADCKLPISFRGLHTPDVYKSRDQLGDLATMLSTKLRPDAASEGKLNLSEASSNRFLDELKDIVLNQSPRFKEQFSREWAFGARNPVLYWGGGLAIYFVCVLSLVALLDVGYQVAGFGVSAAWLVLYLLYRGYRLSRSG